MQNSDTAVSYTHLLEGIHSWFKKEQKIRNTIVGSVFKKKVMREVPEDISLTEPEENSQESILEKTEELCNDKADESKNNKNVQ